MATKKKRDKGAKQSNKVAIKDYDIEDNLLKHKWIGIAIIVLFLSVMFFKIGFLGYEPLAHDTHQWRATANESINYNKTHSDPALWNSNIFSGMPNYLISFPIKYPYINNAIMSINSLINWKLSFLLLGALGAFFLLKYLKMGTLTSTIFGLAFALSSHFVALIEMGHNTKFQAIMVLPWLLYAFIYLKDKKNLLGLGFFTVALITQLRLNHLQITYYFFLFLGIFWIYELVVNIRNREIKPFTIFTLLLILGVGIAALAVANPHLSNMEYAEFSMRGGETGLTKEYAQGWSMHPGELMSLVFPNFFGGINQDYWGWMSFTQAYHYTGVIVLIFAILALFLSKKKYTKIFGIGVLAAVIMSFGKYLPFISNLLHDYLPGFNKFRVPATHLVIAQLLLIPLAAIGLKEVLKRVGNEKFSKAMKLTLIVVVALFFVNIVGGSSLFGGMKFFSANELAQFQNYQPSPELNQQIEYLRNYRLNLTLSSVRNGLFFIALGVGLIFFYTKKMLPKNFFIILIGIVLLTDIAVVNSAYFKNLTPRKKQQELPMTGIDRFLKKNYATGSYRIFSADNINDVSWAAHLQTIGGYHGAKLLRYNDVLNNAMNLNVINMLNAKFFISKENIGQSPLTSIKQGNTLVGLYLNQDALDRAWFVNDWRIIADSDERVAFLNNPQFRPRQLAVIESDLGFSGSLGRGRVVQIPQDDYMHKVAFEINDLTADGFLVVSEIYYPAGWKAFVDGVETEIYPVNHILRGVKIPAGAKNLEMVFTPDSYYLSTKLSLTGIILSIIILGGGIFCYFKKKGEVDGTA